MLRQVFGEILQHMEKIQFRGDKLSKKTKKFHPKSSDGSDDPIVSILDYSLLICNDMLMKLLMNHLSFPWTR